MKDRKTSYQVMEAFAFFYSLIALTLYQNRVKNLRVTKIYKENKFEWVWGELKSKKGFQRQSVTISETNSSFHVKERTTEKV